MTRLIDTEPTAVKIFEDFHAKGSKRKEHYKFTWPGRMQEVGRAQAQLYRSNKWKFNPRETEDYKHIAEAPQYCYVTPGFLRDASGKKALPVYGDMVQLEEDMPKHFSILAPLIGVQLRLYNENKRLPKGDNGLYEVVIAQGMLGASRFPRTDAAFLVVYTRAGGVHMIITGDELDVERDGIVG